MGMFDELTVKVPLPHPRHQKLVFQTKSLDSCLSHYEITEDGHLVEVSTMMGETINKRVKDFHGDILFYAIVNAPNGRGTIYALNFGTGETAVVDADGKRRPFNNPIMVNYRARFTNGVLQDIVETDEWGTPLTEERG